MSEPDTINTLDFLSVPLGEIAYIEMGQSPDSRYVIDDPFVGHPFLQGNAEFGAVFPEPKYGCLRPAKLCKTDDVLISVRAPVGAVNVADRDYCIGRGLAAIRANGIKPSLVGEIIARQSSALRRVSQGTTFEAINKSDLLTLSLKLPPEDEWEHVAVVLDTLDTAIHQTEAIIAKLKAVKQGLLHDLLTRGIDANGELRPPQTEAPHLYKESPLGWIPTEWRAERLSDITTLVTSGSRGWAAYYSDAGDLFVRSQNIRIGNLDFSDCQHVSLPVGGEGQRTRLESLDLLITITGNSVGNVAHIPDGWSEVAYVSQHVGLVRFIEPPLVPLAKQFLVQGAPGNSQLLDAQYGQSKPGLSLDNLRNLYIPVPPSNERELIVVQLSCAQKRVEDESQYVNQLRQLKSGLMDDLISGRVRVTPLLEGATHD